MRALVVTGRLAEEMVREAVGDRADVLVMDVRPVTHRLPHHLLGEPSGHHQRSHGL